MNNLEIFGIPYLKKGKGIHIKKENRGKFTDYCGGEVTNECIQRAKKSKNPKLRKRATFAANSRRWAKKHQEGGTIRKYYIGQKITTENIPESQQYAVTTPDGQRKLFNSKEEATNYITANTPEGYNLYDTTRYASNISKEQNELLAKRDAKEISDIRDRENIREHNQEMAHELLSSMPVVGDVIDGYQIVKDGYNGDWKNMFTSLGLLALPEIPGLKFLTKKGLKIPKKASWFSKTFFPKKAKKLDEALYHRRSMQENPYEYVSDKSVKEAISPDKSETHLFRGVGSGSISFNDLTKKPSSAAAAEVTALRQVDPTIELINFPTFTSINPGGYLRNAKEIHVQPITDFSKVYSELPWGKRREYGINTPNSYDSTVRIVPGEDFRLDSGDHFVFIPQANSYARMKPNETYNIGKSYDEIVNKDKFLYKNGGIIYK